MGTFISVLLGTMFGSAFIIARDRPPHGRLRHDGLGRHCLADQSPHSASPGTAARAQDRAEFCARDLARHPPGGRAQGRVSGDPRHFLVLVSGRRLPHPDSGLHAPGSVRRRIGRPTLVIVTFTIGIGFGSVFTNWLLKGEVSAKYVPIAAILITVFMIDLYFATPALRALAPSRRPHADPHRSSPALPAGAPSSISGSSPSAPAFSACRFTRSSRPRRRFRAAPG